MVFSSRLFRQFFLLRTPGLALRLLAVALAAGLLFSQVFLPLRIQGQSMEPTFRDHGFAFCWRQRYWFGEPERGDVVAIRLAGSRVLLLKRVVALAGDTVAFDKGWLLVNGLAIDEPYVRFRETDWNLAPRLVEEGKVYVVGDNRGVTMEGHVFGQVDRQRIIGKVFW